MTDAIHNAWRFVLAERIAAAYAADPNARVVMIAGSVGRGTADQFSDIGIDVYYDRPPTDDERRASVERCGGALDGLDEDDDEWKEQIVIGGFHAASSTFLCATMERSLTEVERGAIAPGAQARLYSLLNSVAVKGAEQVEAWRARAHRYPPLLADAMLRENLSFEGFWYAEEMLAERDDWLELYEVFVGVEKQIVRALLVLNRQYLPAPERFTWLNQTIAAMPIKPRDLAARLKAVFRGDPRDGVRDLKAVIVETMALVEQHYPAFDTAPYRENFTKQRPRWDEPPPDLGL